MTKLLFVFMVIASLTSAAAAAMLSHQQRKQYAANRIYKFVGQGTDTQISDTAAERKVPSLKTRLRVFMRTLARPFAQWKGVQRWQLRLEQAAVALPPNEFFVLRLLLCCATLIVFGLLWREWALGMLCAIVGYVLPGMAVRRRSTKRIQRCAAQLPAALGTMATAMKAGFSFPQAMQQISKELPDPLGTEFARTLRDMNVGVSTEEAFKQLIGRIPDKDLELVVSALMVQRTTGGDLVGMLTTMEETIRARVRMKAELRVLTSQGKLSAWIITLLPVALGFLLNLMNPSYFSPLFSTIIGWVLLGFAGVSLLIGWVMIQKIIRIGV